MLQIQASMVYPPKDLGSDTERYFTPEALAGVLGQFGGLEHYVCRAAYFRFENDFHGFMRESLEVFDSHYMPYFSENTVNIVQYEAAKAIFSKALTDVCADITHITRSYVGTVQFTHVEARSGHGGTIIIVLR